MGLLSSVQSEVLENGLRIAVMQVKRPIVDFRIAVGAGTATEGRLAGSGVSHFLEHMLFRGTSEYSRREITDMVPSRGGDINAFTSDSKTVVEMSVLRECFEDSLAMGLSMVMSPNLDKRDFDEEREIVRREIVMGKDSPSRRSWYQIQRIEYAGTPLSYPVLGVEDIFDTLTRDDMVRYHGDLYVPGNCVVTAVGDVGLGELTDFVRQRCAKWKARPVVKPQLSFFQYGGRVVRSTFNDKTDCLIVARTVASPAESNVQSLMMRALAGSDVSPVYREMVRDSSLALHCDGGFNYTTGGNGFTYLCTQTKNGGVPAAERHLLSMLEKLSRTGVAISAINAAKHTSRQDYYKLLKTNYGGIASLIADNWLIDGSPDFSDAQLKRELAVTKEMVDEALRSFLSGLGPDISSVSAKPVGRRGRIPFPGGDGLEKLEACGCPVVFEHARDEEYVDCRLMLPGGRLNEPQYGLMAGRLFNGLVRCGGGGMTEERYRKELNRLDASVSVRSGRANSVIGFHVPVGNLGRLGELFRLVVDAPEFGESQFERERDNLIVSIRMLDVDPVARALKESTLLQYGADHLFCAYCNLPAVESLTCDKVLDCWRRMWQKGRCVMAIAGGCTRQAALEFAETLLSTPVMHKAVPSLTAEIPECRFAERDVVIPGRDQLGVVKSTIIPGHSEPRPGVLSSLVGELLSGGSSRLFKRVREDNSLAYFVDGSCGTCYDIATELTIVASCAPEHVREVEKLFDEEIRYRARFGLTRDEFTKVQAAMKMRSARRCEDPLGMCASLATELYYGLEPTSAEERFDFYSKLEYEDVAEQMRKAFRGKPFVVARAGAPVPGEK